MGLELDDDRTFRAHERRAQSVGLTFLGVVLVAGLLGAIGGPGLLSTAAATDASRLVIVDFQRFLHREADDTIRIQLAAEAVTAPAVDVEISSGWVDAVAVNTILPSPLDATQDSRVLRLRIPATRNAAVTVTIHYRANSSGLIEGWAGFPDVRVPFRQFVYP